MCGFFGIVFKEERNDLGSILYKAGERLSYRGYDSAGIAFFDEKGYEIRKDAGSIEEVGERLKFKDVKGYKGIIQLRWATFGTPSPENAQPHDDCKKNLVGAHNGNITNTVSLKKMLIDRRHTVRGDNDGEIVLHVVEEMFTSGASTMNEAIESANTLLQGDYAYVITDTNDKERMFAIKKGSSMFAGVAENYICVSSDLTAVLDHTDKVILIKDNEYIEFTPHSFVIRDLKGNIIDKKPVKIDIPIENAQKGEHAHFMIKEIIESGEKVKTLLDVVKEHEGYKKAVKILSSDREIYMVGAGTSYNALLLGSFYFADIARKNVHTFFGSGFSRRYGNLIKDDDVLFAVSQSGETKDVKNIVLFFKDKVKGTIIGLYNMIGSTLSYLSDIVLPTVCDMEISVPATKTFINQCTAFLYLAEKTGQKKGIFNDKSNIENIPQYLKEVLDNDKEIDMWAEKLKDSSVISVLGYGIMHPVALEGALKIKETAYKMAEPMFSGEFKHGPLAIIEDDFPVIFITTGEGEDRSMIISHISEVKTRNGKIFTISPYDEEIISMSDYHISLSENIPYHIKPIIAAYIMQILSYKLSVKIGLDPDRPRNISKTITVD